MPRIYLDNAASTPLYPRVGREMKKYEKTHGNASSLHTSGRRARGVVESSRKKVADILNCAPEEIIFTGSGTEANNLAVLGAARANRQYGKHVITTKIEHHSVLNACQHLESEGFRVTYLPVGKSGIVDPEIVKRALKSDKILVSVMYANNEIGTIQPVAKISRIIRDFNGRRDSRILFHADAIQAAGYLDLNVQKLGVDLMSLNGSKIYGPRGIGCLFVRRGTAVEPLVFGGSQEQGLRPGTESPALIAGFTKALGIAEAQKNKENKRLEKLRDHAIREILKIPGSSLNGDPEKRLPNNINISFKDISGEALVLELDKRGIEVSTGAACTTTETHSTGSPRPELGTKAGQSGPSHVLKALRQAQGKPLGNPDNLRITLGRFTTQKEIDRLLKILPQAIKKVRKIYAV